jgi:hypothetical protein
MAWIFVITVHSVIVATAYLRRNSSVIEHMGIPTPPLSLFEGQTPSGRPIGKCHSDHSILNFDGLSISSPDSAQVTA